MMDMCYGNPYENFFCTLRLFMQCDVFPRKICEINFRFGRFFNTFIGVNRLVLFCSLVTSLPRPALTAVISSFKPSKALFSGVKVQTSTN